MLRRVEVAVRVRQISSDERVCVTLDEANNAISAYDETGLYASSPGRRYREDLLLDETVSNREVFERLILKKMQAVTEGSPDTLCFLAYGHTSSGKTHTIMGSESAPGVLTLCVEELLRREGVVEVAMLEVYMDNIHDLLAEGSPRRVRRRQGAIVVEGLTTCSIVSIAQWQSVAAFGMRSRRTAPTERNPRSSRSHAIFSVKTRCARMCLVDLAGSERQDVFSPQLNKESISINKSLSRLSTVLEALSMQTIRNDGSRSYVNFRDTALTVLLQRYLSGASMTTFLACVHPAARYYQETVSTLRYTQRLKKIQTLTTRPNSHVSNSMRSSENQALLDQLVQLQQQLQQGEASNKRLEASHQQRVAELEAALATHQKVGRPCSGGQEARVRDTKRVAGWLLSRVLGNLPQLNVGYDEYFDSFFPSSVQVIGYVSTMVCLAPRPAGDSNLAFLDVGNFAMGLSMVDAGIPPLVRLHRVGCCKPDLWEGHECDEAGHLMYVLAFFEVNSQTTEWMPCDGTQLSCCGGYVSSEPLLPIATVLCVATAAPSALKESILQKLITLQGEQEEAMMQRDGLAPSFEPDDCDESNVEDLLDSIVQQNTPDPPSRSSDSDTGIGRELLRQAQTPGAICTPFRETSSDGSKSSNPSLTIARMATQRVAASPTPPSVSPQSSPPTPVAASPAAAPMVRETSACAVFEKTAAPATTPLAPSPQSPSPPPAFGAAIHSPHPISTSDIEISVDAALALDRIPVLKARRRRKGNVVQIEACGGCSTA